MTAAPRVGQFGTGKSSAQGVYGFAAHVGQRAMH
jgi:hypothetical protein